MYDNTIILQNSNLTLKLMHGWDHANEKNCNLFYHLQVDTHHSNITFRLYLNWNIHRSLDYDRTITTILMQFCHNQTTGHIKATNFSMKVKNICSNRYRNCSQLISLHISVATSRLQSVQHKFHDKTHVRPESSLNITICALNIISAQLLIVTVKLFWLTTELKGSNDKH